MRETVSPPSAVNALGSLSYAIGTPEQQAAPMDDEGRARIDRELASVATVAQGIRLYSSVGRNAEIPAMARRHGLTVALGAWVGTDPAANRAEAAAAVDLAQRHPNVRTILVGNEVILREDLKPDELIEVIRDVRRRARQPVSTGETWDIWLAHPELVREVDFLAVHILPYWEGIDPALAADYAFDRYAAVRRAYPGKRVVIAEFGWPSRGYNNRAAFPGPTIQAEVIRAFVRRAYDRGIAFNIIEAFDQPWKTREGSVGAYWGLFDAGGALKFPLDGTYREQTFYPRLILALVFGAVGSIAGLALFRSTFAHALVFALTCNALAAPMALASLYPVENYLNAGSAVAWLAGMALMVPLSLMTLIKIHEMADVTLGYAPRRLIRPPIPVAADFRWPKVSVHVPAYREKPEMLVATLESLSRLDYPDFEVLAIVNNTPDEAFWRPVEAACARLGPRFKFLNFLDVKGFKAGALNRAMPQMAADAGIIALLDADYVVEPGWLRDLVSVFDDPGIGLVQAPQDHRDGDEGPLKALMNSEYAGFFDVGMVQRNEHDAVIAHGTMLLIRRAAFEQVGGWATDTITEDTELGLRLFEAGWGALYTDRRYGRGLLPDNLQAFMTQRHRWAYGAMQIIRKHWRHMLPQAPSLSAAQKAQFVTGWSYWLSDAFGVLAAYLNLFWVPLVVFVGVLIPMLPFTLPILSMFVVNLLHCIVLYMVRVRIAYGRILGAALAAMSLQMTVGRAVAEGLSGIRLGFKRTDKGGIAAYAPFPARREAWLGGLLLGGATLIFATNSSQTIEIHVFAATLLVQSVPFLAAAGLAVAERRQTV
ncbi:MAG: glycosyltransferase [Rhodospirillales bacterium]